jgi:capsular polysaccharide biosynthesis protein
MSEQPLDLRRSLRILRRHKIFVAAFAALGLAGGLCFAALSTPMLTSNALVVLPSSVHDISTQVVIATSDPVLTRALRTIDPGESPQTLRSAIKVKNLTTNIISVTAPGKTAAQAERTADAVADSYVAYVNSPSRPGPPVQARILQPALGATGPSPIKRMVTYAALGVLAGLLLGAIVVLATRRRERRLQERDEIADAIGIPVLTSVQADRPTDATGWRKLFEDYQPGSVDAWRLRKTLRWLWPVGVNGSGSRRGSGSSLAVVSLSSDPNALALGPQLAVFAASLGIPTTLIVGPQQDTNATATLRTACATPLESSARSGNLRVTVSDQHHADQPPDAGLAVVVAVVDGENPRVADTMRATATVLAVSAGVVTAQQLARVATSAATDGRDIAGTIVGNPDPADHTTGRVPELSRPAHRRMPTRITDEYAGTRR